MEITYHLKEKDLILGKRFIRKVSPAVKRSENTALIFVALSPCIRFFLQQQFSAFFITKLLLDIAISILFFKIFKAILLQILDRQAAMTLKHKGKGIIGEHTICLTEDEVIESTSFNQSHSKWAGIAGLYQNEDYIFIMMGNLQGHIIPKRAFTSHDATMEFYNQAQTYYQNVNES